MSVRLGHSQLDLEQLDLPATGNASDVVLSCCKTNRHLSECTGEALGVGAKHSNSLGLLSKALDKKIWNQSS